MLICYPRLLIFILFVSEWSLFFVTLIVVSCYSQTEENFYLRETRGDISGPYLPQVTKNLPRVGRRNDFFLKAAKSVPRIGRRDNDFLLKTAKNVPRVGKRGEFFVKAAKSVPRIGRRNDFFLKASKSVPRIGRRNYVDCLPYCSETHLRTNKRNELLSTVWHFI